MPRPKLIREWTGEDLVVLRQLWTQGVPAKTVAFRLRRTAAAVDKKARQLGLRLPVNQGAKEAAD
jgi:hypothetical protein